MKHTSTFYQAALAACNTNGRVVICGVISGANNVGEPYGVKVCPGRFEPISRHACSPISLAQTTPQILMKQLTVRGFGVFTSEPQYEGTYGNPVRFLQAITPLVESGQVKWNEQVLEGIDKVGEGIVAVQEGTSTAKVNVKVADP